jgi:uncharacterized damage-inducible protein DinB
MKTTKEFLLGLIDAETEKFVNVFNALPADKLDWKPDAKSKTAGELASMMAMESGQIGEMLATGILTYDPSKDPKFTSTAEMGVAFKAGMEKAKAAVQPMTDADWDGEAKMVMVGSDNVWKDTKGGMALGFMLDLIHHRGQLSTYIRPMGGKVPSIYGPSADTQ